MMVSQLQNAEINYISNAGTASKKGFDMYKRFINSVSNKINKLTNNVKETTIWDKIKRIKDKK